MWEEVSMANLTPDELERWANQGPLGIMFIGGPLDHERWEIGPEGGPPIGWASSEDDARQLAAIPAMARNILINRAVR